MLKNIFKSKTFYLAAAVLIAGAVVLYFYAYPVIKSRYFPSKQSSGENSEDLIDEENFKNDSETPNDIEEQGSSENSENSGESGIDGSEPVDLSQRNNDGEVMANITPEHCNTDCKAFANNLSYFEYCQQVCGISPVKDVSNCDGEKDIRKDYCLKDLAVKKEDSSLCNEIKDSNIRTTCKNRILEDILEKQQ